MLDVYWILPYLILALRRWGSVSGLELKGRASVAPPLHDHLRGSLADFVEGIPFFAEARASASARDLGVEIFMGSFTAHWPTVVENILQRSLDIRAAAAGRGSRRCPAQFAQIGPDIRDAYRRGAQLLTLSLNVVFTAVAGGARRHRKPPVAP